MGITPYPNGISSMGSPVTSGTYLTTGSVFYADSNTGSNGYPGISPDKPVASLYAAVQLCTSGLGDTIFLMPNHSETISSSSQAEISKSGVNVIGLGRGENRPTFTFDTATGSQIRVSSDAHSVRMENLLLKSGLDALEHIIQLRSSACHVVNCEYQQVGAFEAAKVVEVSSEQCGGILIDGLIVKADTDAGGTDMDNVIFFNNVARSEVKNCYLQIATTGGLICSSSADTTGTRPSWIHHNYLEQINDDMCVEWSTGTYDYCVISDNIMKKGGATLCAIGTSTAQHVWAFNNRVINGDGESGGDCVLIETATT